jgi:hypothetical protein
MSITFIFVDGVGLGAADPQTNAFAAADMPVMRALLDGRAVTGDNAPYHSKRASLIALDATLGFPGLPQSGTGQAALLTGEDAVKMHGRHFGPWVPARLRPLVRDYSILARARAAGHAVAFANAYPEEAVAGLLTGDLKRAPRFLRAGPPIAAIGAGVLNRHTPELERGAAIASEITNDSWRHHLRRASVPVIDAATAGRNLARISGEHDLSLFAHYSTDYAGHRQNIQDAIKSVQLLDVFIGGLVSALPDDALVVIASDHGNVEDCTTGHTRNPALGFVFGSGHEELTQRWTCITDVAPSLLTRLGVL